MPARRVPQDSGTDTPDLEGAPMPAIIDGKIVMPDPRPVMATRSPVRYRGPSDATRRAVLERDGYCCVCCGQSVRGRRYSLQLRGSLGSSGRCDPAATAMSNLVTMAGSATTGCRSRVESWLGPDDGREDSRKGYRLGADQDARAVPVWYARERWAGWRWLTDDGLMLL
jgi:hypothetical protein